MVSSWQAVTPLMPIQEEPETSNLVLFSPAPDTTSQELLSPPLPPQHLDLLGSQHSPLLTGPQYNSPGSTVSNVLLSPRFNPSTTGSPLLVSPRPQPQNLSPQYIGNSPQPRQSQSPLLVPPTSRSRSVSPNQAMLDLSAIIDFDDLLGSHNYIVTDGHKPENKRQSKEKSDQGKTKPKENEIEEKMANLVM